MELSITNSELSDLISDIYEGSLTGNWQPTLTKLMEYTGSNKTFFVLQHLNQETPLLLEMKANFDFPPEAVIHYQENFESDPCHQTTQSLTEGEYHYCNEYVDLTKYRNDEYFKKVFIPMKTFHVLVGVLCRDGKHESVIAVNRGEDEPSYSILDKNLFHLVTPHLSRAMHIYKELRLYKKYANISKSIIDQQDKAILVCDVNGNVVINNDFAIRHLTSPSVVRLNNGILRVDHPLYEQQLKQYIRQCATLAFNDIGTQETLLIEQNDRDSLLITVAPLPCAGEFNDLNVPCCLVSINYQREVRWDAVFKEFSLTPKELALLKAVYSMRKLNDLTELFNVSYNTLRSHMQTIFKKTQVNSQTELLIMISMFK